jgi:hypothetical protein
MNVTPEQAAQALQDIEISRLAMRKAVRSHRGHLFLWLWGAIWAVMAVLNWINPYRYAAVNGWLNVFGAAASVAIGFLQGRQIRSPIDKRFVAACVTVLVFGYVIFPLVGHGVHGYAEGYAIAIITWMQVYILGGIWFDTYWVWIGIIVTALILVGFLLLPALFWGFVLLAAFTLIGSGFYVRLYWR